MRLRELPGALALGIPAAILAHAMLFQGGHQLGGSLHEAVLGAATAASVGFVLFFATFSFMNAKSATSGSLLAARLIAWLPGTWLLGTSALGWYTAIESSEADHAPAPVLALALAIVVCAIAVRWVARCLIATIASITLAARVRPFLGRPRAFAPRRPKTICTSNGRIAAYRRFARPPPLAMQSA